MRNYDHTDMRFYGSDPVTRQPIVGDLVAGTPDDEGLVDFALTDELESARQDMTNRVRTQTGDWRSHPKIGGDLELLEGEPNTRETGERGENQIFNTLTYDGRFALNDLEVRGVPESIDHIRYYMIVDSADDEEPLVVSESLNL